LFGWLLRSEVKNAKPNHFYDIPGRAVTPHVAVHGHCAYVTSQGIRVLGASDPGAPVQVGAYPIASGNLTVTGETVYVISSGLFILRPLVCAGPDVVPDAPPAQNGKCETYTAAMTVSARATTLQAGEVLTVTVTLVNQGCGKLGLPQYRLYVESDEAQPVFIPSNPDPVVHYLGIAPGQSDAAEFVLRAVGSGQATLSASASFEVHLSYPGPGYWGGSSAGPLVITVTP
jgi:hypothetical protein